MIAPNLVLSAVPASLRTPLLDSFGEITKNYTEQRWEPSELNGGKFCECAYTVINGYLTDSYATAPSKPSNMVQACNALEQIPPNPTRVGDRSFRIQIPRMILPLYEIRNNRGVGHAGGDVNPNFMDAIAVLSMSSWILAELVRVFHSVSTADAQKTVDALVERKHPLVWKTDDVRRVLDPEMPAKDQVLLLLNSEAGWINEDQLLRWVEYSGLNMFQRRVLIPLHDDRLIEYDMENSRIKISPRGVKDVEDRILKEWVA